MLSLFLERSEQAVAELHSAHFAAAESLALNVLGDRRDAEECACDALLAVWNTVPPTQPKSIKAYFLGITRKRAIERYHALGAAKRCSRYDAALDELFYCIADTETAESICEAKALGEAINTFLATLRKEDRQLFVRRYWLGEELSDAAADLGMAPQRASLRLFRIRERLKKYLMKEGMLEWTGR